MLRFPIVATARTSWQHYLSGRRKWERVSEPIRNCFIVSIVDSKVVYKAAWKEGGVVACPSRLRSSSIFKTVNASTESASIALCLTRFSLQPGTIILSSRWFRHFKPWRTLAAAGARELKSQPWGGSFVLGLRLL